MKLEWRTIPFVHDNLTVPGCVLVARTMGKLYCGCDYHFTRTVIDQLESGREFVAEVVFEHMRIHNEGCPNV